MRVLPVIDLMGGQVVRGVAGRRTEYRPIVSRLTSSTAPLEVARAFRKHFGLDELYLADLDAIGGKRPALDVCAGLMTDGFRLWVDAGVSEMDALAAVGVETLMAGLESLEGPAELRGLVDRFGAERLVFSLDLQGGQALGRADAWCEPARDIARRAIELGVERMLVLDLAAVGMNEGSRTADLCGWLRREFPTLEVTTGGGVRGRDDLQVLQRQGVDRVLIATALHDGRLDRTMLDV